MCFYLFTKIIEQILKIKINTSMKTHMRSTCKVLLFMLFGYILTAYPVYILYIHIINIISNYSCRFVAFTHTYKYYSTHNSTRKCQQYNFWRVNQGKQAWFENIFFFLWLICIPTIVVNLYFTTVETTFLTYFLKRLMSLDLSEIHLKNIIEKKLN